MQVERFSKSPKTTAVRLAGLRSCSISELKQQWRTIGRQELFVTNVLFEVVEQRRHLFVECLLDRDFVGLAVHEATPDHAREKNLRTRDRREPAVAKLLVPECMRILVRIGGLPSGVEGACQTPRLKPRAGKRTAHGVYNSPVGVANLMDQGEKSRLYTPNTCIHICRPELTDKIWLR